MSKNIITIGAVSLVSLMAGMALSLAFTAEAIDVAVPDDGTDAMHDVAGELKKTQVRLDRVERVLARELAATRRDVRDALDQNAIASSRVRVASPGAATAGRGGENHAIRKDGGVIADKNIEALGPMANWKEDAELRKKWLFTSEQQSLDAFGAPDEVTTRGPTEWWTYWNITDDKIASEYRVKFNNGRLVQTQLVKWEKPRRMPTAQH